MAADDANERDILTLKPAADAPFTGLISNVSSTMTDNTSVTYIPWDSSTNAGWYCPSCGRWIYGNHFCPGRCPSGGWTQIWTMPIKEDNGMTNDEKRELVALLKQMVKDKQLTQAGYVRILEHCYLEDL